MRKLKPLTREVEWGKVVSRGEGGGEGVDANLLSDTLRNINFAEIPV